MGLSTHVLDTMHGCPAAGMRVGFQKLQAGEPEGDVREIVLNADGRNPDGPLVQGANWSRGRYRLTFHVGEYFAQKGVQLPDPSFLDVVHLDFGVADPSAHYHVPLLVSPWSYSTYRGS